MAEFSYRAVDIRGKAVSGVMNVMNENALEDVLRESGYWLVKAQKKKLEKQQDTRRRIRIKRRDLIDMAMGIAPMLTAGVPLVESLDEIARESRNPDIRWVLEDMGRNIRAGGNLHETMDAHPGAFPAYMRYLVRAGEQSGKLSESFVELRRYLEWVDRLAGQIKQASIYPLVALLAVGLFVMLLFSFVVPRFAALLAGLDIPLPLPTRIVVAVGGFMSHWWWVVLIIPLGVWAGVHLARKRSPLFARAVDHAKLSIPLFGEINRMLALSRFAHHFAVLYRAGIPLLDIMHITQKLVGNEAIADSLNAARLEVSEGSTLSEAMRKHDVFSPMLLRMVAVGDSTGSMDSAMTNVSDFYDEEIPRRINRLFAVIEPAIIITLVSIVGGVALALFLPMMSLMSAVK